MAKNNEALPNSDLSKSNNKMTDSNLEDDTEDYIQPSQPLSFQSPGVQTASKRIPTNLDQMSISTIDETLPFPKLISTPFEDISRDFIPESENPVKRKIEALDIDEGCKKRLNLDLSSLIKETPDMFSTQSQLNDTIDAAQLKASQSLPHTDLGNVSLVPESPPRISEIVENEHSYTMFSESHKRGVLEETAAEDSFNAGSSDLYATDKSKADISDIQEERKMDRTGDKIGDDIITIESSSKFIDDSGMSSLLRSDNPTDVEEGKRNVTSQETELDDTIDADDIKCYTPYSSDRKDVEVMNGNTIPPVSEGLSTPIEKAATESAMTPIDIKPETCRLKSVLKNISDEELARLQKHSTPENPLSKSPKIDESASSIENGTPPVEDGLMKSSEINFTVYLQLDCQLVVDPLKGEPISKKIVNVKELPKRQPKHFQLETNSDSYYKTKRLSSSSSGSVYSDKTGLPYALPNRSLPMSVNSSSSSVDLAKHVQIVGRQVWVNEYKIPMAMDEIIPRYIKLHKSGSANKEGKSSTTRKMSMRLRKKSHWSHPLDNVLESSVTEQSSGNNSDDLLQRLEKAESPEPNSTKEVNESNESQKPEGGENKKEMVMQEDNTLKKENCNSESVGDTMTEGLLVFARWTDKRYYPGIVQSKAKYDRWDVKFDDGTEKVIREDLILPLNWLTKGELVFALAADKYMSGKIADIVREEDIQFKIELDDTNEEVIVKKCDVCLNDVMAGIIREKFKPTTKAVPPLKSCDIDVDNVVTGKRVREQRTPIRGVTSILQAEGSTAKKRRGGLRFSEGGTDDNQTPFANRALQSEKKTRCSSRKKGSKPSLSSVDVRPEVEDFEKYSGNSEQNSDAKRKRSRALKYDSDKLELPNKNEEMQTSEIQKESSNACKNESAINFAEKAEAAAEEATISKKVSKSQRGKSDKVGVRVSIRPSRSKPLTASQDVRRKRKNAERV